MRILIPLLWLLSLPLCAQQIDKIYKENGVWKGNISGPLSTYPATGLIVKDTTAIPDPPVVVVPPVPTDDTTKIDGRNGTFVGSWTHAAQAGNGWFKNTLSYANVANNTVTYKFQGTKLELWGERLAKHGIGTVTIRQGTTVIHTATADFRPQPNDPAILPARVYSSIPLLPNVNYTVELKVGTKPAAPSEGWNLIDFLVITNYQESTAGVDPPIPPIEPPTGDYILVNTGQDYRNIINTASKNVRLSPGTYVGPFNLQVGVSMLCDNATLTNTVQGSESGGTKIGIINLNSSSRVAGNQTIQGCIIDGKDIAYAGIMSNNRDAVVIDKCTIKNTNFTGAWFTNSANIKVINSTFENAGWADYRYIVGALMIHNVNGILIENNNFISNKNNKGSGIETNSLVKEGTISNMKVLRNRFNLSKYNPWNNGSSANFSLELHNTYIRDCEIAYNDFQNEISFASHRPGNGSKNWIHHNTGNLAGNTYFIETIADDFLIENNTVINCSMFLANMQPNSQWKNWLVRNNSHTGGTPPAWGSAVLIGPSGVSNVVLENNILPSPVVKYMGVQGGITIK